MANPIQQGLKPFLSHNLQVQAGVPQWLIQYNKD